MSIRVGVMMSSLVVLMTAGTLSPSACVKSAACVLILWTIGLHLFWYFLIPPIESSDNLEGMKSKTVGAGSEESKNEGVVSEGWKQKIKCGGEDKRLPTTIVTGFLVRN